MKGPLKRWYRLAPLDGATALSRREVWELRESDHALASFPVEVRIGKHLDVVRLKGTSLSEIRDYASFLHETAGRLYSSTQRREVRNCPCCAFTTKNAHSDVSIFGVAYHRCIQCGHAFVLSQPEEAALNAVFSDSEEHSTTYTDINAAEIRLTQVIKPKVEWMSESFSRHYGRRPSSVIDVGAGGGHFVAGLAREGIASTGFELSRSSRRFAKEVFDLDLQAKSFLEEPPQPGHYDAITFWGLLEYTPEPRRFLDIARRWFKPGEGMLVAEVPRFDCIGTAVQGVFSDRVARHLDPTSHVNCFSDGSLATALTECGFKPIAAWYFGMDIYELLIQFALELDDMSVFERLVHLIPRLQTAVDAGLMCDDIVVAAVPI